jgi:signal peptidase
LKVGDVIQYRLGGTAVLHRIVEIKDAGGSRTFVTRGDNNDVADKNPVVAQSVTGKVILKIPEAGWVPIRVHDAVTKLKEML